MPSKIVDLPKGYKPSEDEEYMCQEHLEYFRRKLLQWREDLIQESQETINNLRGEVRDVGDEAERASRETENSLELRTRDRYRKLLNKIDQALVLLRGNRRGNRPGPPRGPPDRHPVPGRPGALGTQAEADAGPLRSRAPAPPARLREEAPLCRGFFVRRLKRLAAPAAPAAGSRRAWR